MATGEARECEYCGGEYSGEKGLRPHQSQAHSEQITAIEPCHWCGSDVEVNEWNREGRHYCSRECSGAWNSFLRQGKRHPNYVDGSTRGKWFEWVSMAVRWRDGECLRCGDEQGASDGRRLHVHHIVPEGECEDPKDPTNLLSVCGSCHQKLEQMEPARQLEVCGIDSRSELELTGDAKRWLMNLQETTDKIANAPDPRLQVFAEADRLSGENA